MAKPNEKLADSLTLLRDLRNSGANVIRSRQLSRIHRQRLLRGGFIQEVMKGWLIPARPDVSPGDSTAWYASFWEFCAGYCEERFGHTWHLSPEQSLLLHAENTVVPTQLMVLTPRGNNNQVQLLFGTSLFDLRESAVPSQNEIVVRDGIRIFAPAAALVRAGEAFFTRHPVEARVLLAQFRDSSELLVHLLEGGHSVVAGRLAGACRFAGRADIAADILKTMVAAGYDVRECNPFEGPRPAVLIRTGTAPIVARLQALWQSQREAVLAAMPAASGIPPDATSYLQFIDDIYQTDAYNSLSIEGYHVTPELIERVGSGNWDPARHDGDRQGRDALAARGYWQAFQLVKRSVAEVLKGADPASVVRDGHGDWYREMFQPSVAAGLLEPTALAGYRNDAVYLRSSRHVPPRWEAVRDAMPALFDLIASEPEPAVRAVLGHWLFGYIHPYPDGNGRMARFLMNTLLASGGYPWTIIRVEDRIAYLAGLERASVDGEIEAFGTFVASSVRRSEADARLHRLAGARISL